MRQQRQGTKVAIMETLRPLPGREQLDTTRHNDIDLLHKFKVNNAVENLKYTYRTDTRKQGR
jgi:hypothetical protein